MSSEFAIGRFSTTAEVAHAIGVHKATLLRWIHLGFVPEPPFVLVGRVRVRMWGNADLTRALEHRVAFYYWTRDQINESKRRTNRLAAIGSDRRVCGAETATTQG